MSNCIYTDADESYEIGEAKLRKARKEWVCCECDDPITPGDLYEHFKGRYDGMWDQFRTCARCVNVRTDFFRGWFFTMMVEDFKDAHGFDYRDGIPADFTPCVRAEP